MRSLIIAHETRALIRSKALFGILALIAAAMIFAAWSGLNHADRKSAGATAAIAFEEGLRGKMRADVEAYEAKIEAEGKEPEFAAVNHAPGKGPPQGVNAGAVGAETQGYAVLPPTGLAAFSIGQSDVQLTYMPVDMRNIFDLDRVIEIENPVNLQAGSFDIAFVVIFLLPIFILAMTYDLLSSEKERGTLAMIMAHPVSLRELMESKLISRARILLTVVLLFGVAALVLVGTDSGSPDTWFRFGFWIAAVLLYSLFWFALAVLVNALGQKSATNGVILAGAWLVFVVIVPTLVSLISTTVYPTPSRMDLTTAARWAQSNAEAARMEALDEYYYDHLELVPNAEDKARDFLTLALANSNAIEKEVRPLHDLFQDQLNKQESVVQRFQYLSPAIMMQLALNEVSGTGADRYEHFLGQVYDYHDQWKAFFSGRFLTRTPMLSAEYDAIPKFVYEEESVGTILLRLVPSVLGLAVLVLAVISLSFAGLRRYKVAAR